MSIGTIIARLTLTIVCAIASLPATAASESRQPPPPSEAPFIPRSDTQVLQQVPRRDTPELKKIYALQHKLKAHPHSLKTALGLAQAYVAFGRGRGDAQLRGLCRGHARAVDG